MKKVYLIGWILLLSHTLLSADELRKAYQKEYAFLKAQKAELSSRLEKDQAQYTTSLEEAKSKLDRLQTQLLALDKNVKQGSSKLEKLTQLFEKTTENGSMLENTVNQARVALGEYGMKLPEGNRTKESQTLKIAFEKTAMLYEQLASIQKSKGAFYLPNGSRVEGEIVKVGNVAAYGISQKASGALAPAGNGTYKLWNAVGSSDDAKALFAGEMKQDIDIFVYENLDKEVEYIKEKTLEDTLEGGGTIGYIILGLGLFGLLLLLYRVFNLLRAGSNVKAISKKVTQKLEHGSVEEALEAVKKYKGSTARVIKSTLRNLGKNREHIEDIVMENILNESSQIDRFGAFVLVIAAVAPLMGLLGTVTGMIETFDVITEFGTGDPKLLSGGISAALVTTMFGLIVAIPLLLLGNLLSGWAQNIKDSMEQSALQIVNLYEKHRV